MIDSENSLGNGFKDDLIGLFRYILEFTHRPSRLMSSFDCLKYMGIAIFSVLFKIC